MFRAFGHRAIGVFLRRTMPVSGGAVRRGSRGAPPAPAVPPRPAPRQGHVPVQAHRAPHLEDLNDPF
jgi:hypothetical protein